MIDATPLLRGYAKLRQRRLARSSPAEQQARELLRLVRHAKDTAFGRDHDFAGITSVADYQARVPLRDFADFDRDYFAAAFPVLTDLTWPGTVPYFAVTSGTTSGRTKHIPVTRQMLRSNARAGTDVLARHVDAAPSSHVMGGKSFMLGGSVAMEDLGHGIKAGDLSGIARLENPRWSDPFVFPSIGDALDADWEQKIDRLARLSLDEPIRCIAGTPSWLLLFFERLAALTGGTRRVSAFYPQLDLMVYGGMSFRPYEALFSDWFDGTDADWREVYSASEGFVASADRGPRDGMRLNTDIGLFYEFVPVDELDAAKPTRHWLGSDPPDGEYALVLSTCAGLWGYVLGDLVRLETTDAPRVTVSGRTAYDLSAFGEHVSGAELERALMAAAADLGTTLIEFAVTPIFPDHGRATGRHLYVVELATVPNPSEAHAFTQHVDHALAAGNADYATHRDGDLQLLAPEIAFMPAGAFRDWMRARGKLGGQNKVPRVVMEGPVRETLIAFAAANRAVTGGNADG